MKWYLACMLALFVSYASANERDAQSHYSMMLTGSVDIDREGAVTAHQLDQESAQLPAPVVAWVAQVVPKWRFASQAVDDGQTSVRTPMKLRVVVEPSSDQKEEPRIRMASAAFGELPPESRVTFKTPPNKSVLSFPIEPDGTKVTGHVYLAIQVGRDGKPMQVMAEQVNLTMFDRPRATERRREMLARAARSMAMNWQFAPPSAGSNAAASNWTVRIPVAFHAEEQAAPAIGQWERYLPGPRREIPWITRSEDEGSGVDALAAGELRTLGTGVQLLTPLDEAPST
ncbi:hypothetical protein AB4059_05120 [Lysobacter sp. 2RAF19]